MDGLFGMIRKAIEEAAEQVKDELIAQGRLFEEEGVILLPETMNLMKEIDEMHKQAAIDCALELRDEETFRLLTGEVHA